MPQASMILILSVRSRVTCVGSIDAAGSQNVAAMASPPLLASDQPHATTYRLDNSGMSSIWILNGDVLVRKGLVLSRKRRA